MRINYRPDNRLLEQRSRLEFHYPRGDVIAFVPFYQNPTITESKTANIVEYNPLGRSSSLFAYTGAKSRKIKLDLKYTLPHLMNFEMGIARFRRYMKDTVQWEKDLFTQWANKNTQKPTDPIDSIGSKLERAYVDLLLKADPSSGKRFKRMEGVPFSMEDANSLLEMDLDDFLRGQDERVYKDFVHTLPMQDRIKAIDTLVFFVNIFRTSVDSNAKNPLYGPPLVRLTHGSLYQSIPCIVKNYNISFEDEAWGYDLETLTPRMVNISVELQEVRVGNFGAFAPATAISRDNLAGWESVIASPQTTDPGQLIK